MRRRKLVAGRVALMLLLLSGSALHAQTVYKCTDQFGNPVFSTDPCGKDAKPVEVQPASGYGSPASAPTSARSPTQDLADSNADSRCRRQAESRRVTGGALQRAAALEVRKAALQKKLDTSPNHFVQTDYELGLRQQIIDTQNSIDQERHINWSREMEADAEYRRALADCNRGKAEADHRRVMGRP